MTVLTMLYLFVFTWVTLFVVCPFMLILAFWLLYKEEEKDYEEQRQYILNRKNK